MTYTIRATEVVARAMARYEGNEILFQEAPKRDDSWATENLIDHYTTYLFTISGDPIVMRWNSFGVHFDPETPIA